MFDASLVRRLHNGKNKKQTETATRPATATEPVANANDPYAFSDEMLPNSRESPVSVPQQSFRPRRQTLVERIAARPSETLNGGEAVADRTTPPNGILFNPDDCSTPQVGVRARETILRTPFPPSLSPVPRPSTVVKEIAAMGCVQRPPPSASKIPISATNKMCGTPKYTATPAATVAKAVAAERLQPRELIAATPRPTISTATPIGEKININVVINNDKSLAQPLDATVAGAAAAAISPPGNATFISEQPGKVDVVNGNTTVTKPDAPPQAQGSNTFDIARQSQGFGRTHSIRESVGMTQTQRSLRGTYNVEVPQFPPNAYVIEPPITLITDDESSAGPIAVNEASGQGREAHTSGEGEHHYKRFLFCAILINFVCFFF